MISTTVQVIESEGWRNIFSAGIIRGLITYGVLCKVMVPVYVVVTFLKFTPVLDTIAGWCAPAMRWFGLPGDAALVLVLGNFVNLYAAIAVITSLKVSLLLTDAHVTILAIMLGISHSQIMETAIVRQMQINAWVVLGMRLIMSLLIGFLVHFFIIST